jgi:hypothetical protein
MNPIALDDCKTGVMTNFPADEVNYACRFWPQGAYNIACVGWTWTGEHLDANTVFTSRLGSYASQIFGATINAPVAPGWSTYTDTCGNTDRQYPNTYSQGFMGNPFTLNGSRATGT